MARRRGLGMGLSALLGEAPARAVAGEEEGPRRVPVEYLEPSPLQPRRDFPEEELEALAESIRAHGLLQPILVRPARGPGAAYEIVAGERRWRAAQRAGLDEVPVVVREIDDRGALELALVENLQREDLDPLEEAEAYARLMREFGRGQEEVARAVGRSRSHVANTLRLLQLPETVRAMVKRGELTAGHARAVLAAADPVALAREVIARGLSVRETEALVRRRRETPARRGRDPAPDPDLEVVARKLSKMLGLRVEIRSGRRGGRVVIRYTTPAQLEAVCRRLADISTEK